MLRTYLCKRFGLNFEDASAVSTLVDEKDVGNLTERFLQLKKRQEIAETDAETVLLVYANRKKYSERYRGNPYGFSTWWLTQESKIQAYIADIMIKETGKCIIRPEFIMYYIAMSPKLHEVDTVYQSLFPSVYGVKLGTRVRPEVFHEVMGRAKQYLGRDAARVTAELESFSNRLKSDQIKRYDAMG